MDNSTDFLQTILNREDAILFVGSGISMWSGLPSWSGFIEELAQFIEKRGQTADLVRSEAAKGDLLQAASYGFTKLTSVQIGEFMRSACRCGKSTPHTIHEKLVKLGPKCFVTTNYDDLLEQSLRTWRPDIKFGNSVTNRNLTEVADLIQASRTEFVFKPHGDVYETDSVILTREQYRELLPQGERHGALEALKTLMVTRPVVYIGFGLRDPDFLYLRDLIANIYTGGHIDHYAIMADVSEEEKSYWRKHFGLHLVSYQTVVKADGKRDHAPLLVMLEKLGERPASIPSLETPSQSDIWLSLARYAAGLGRRWTFKTDSELPVYVTEKRKSKIGNTWVEIPNQISVDEFIENNLEKALLVGAPGTGKSYTFTRHTAILAEDLQLACLSLEGPGKEVKFPIYIDLKLYDGSLLGLISLELPPNISLQFILERFSVRIYVDSFNEMPMEYREGPSFQEDFAKAFRTLQSASIFIGSRSSDGLEELNLPKFELSEYDYDDVLKYTEKNGIKLPDFHKDECINILRRPLYFNLFKEGKVAFSESTHPIDLYVSLIETITIRFQKRFGTVQGLREMLSTVAAAALDSGQEAFDAERFLHYSKAFTEVESINPEDVLNWFIAERFIITHPKRRISFSHQSITEFLAAYRLSELYNNSTDVLKQKLQFNRWDQALFLCTGILAPQNAAEFVEDILSKDILLAIRAARYIEFGRHAIVTRIINFLKQARFSFEQSLQVSWAIRRSLPVELSHFAALEGLLRDAPNLADAIAELLVRLDVTTAKTMLLRCFVEQPDNYSLLANGVGPALASVVEEEDVKAVVAWCDQLEDEHGLARAVDFIGLASGLNALLNEFSPHHLRRLFLPTEGDITHPSFRRKVLSEVIHYRESSEAIKLALELLENGENDAVACLNSNIYRNDEVEWHLFTTNHMEQIIDALHAGDEWAHPTLSSICVGRQDLAVYLRSRAEQASGFAKAALLTAAGSDKEIFFQELAKIPEYHKRGIHEDEMKFLKHVDIDWSGREELLIEILKTRDYSIAYTLLGGAHPPELGNISSLPVGELSWWIDWLVDLASDVKNYWLLSQLSWIVGNNVGKNEITETLERALSHNERVSQLITRLILPEVDDLAWEDLTPEICDYLVSSLVRGVLPPSFSGSVLTKIATEKFTVEKLVPLLARSDLVHQDHVVGTLQRIGARLGRRFVGDDGAIVSEYPLN